MVYDPSPIAILVFCCLLAGYSLCPQVTTCHCPDLTIFLSPPCHHAKGWSLSTSNLITLSRLGDSATLPSFSSTLLFLFSRIPFHPLQRAVTPHSRRVPSSPSLFFPIAFFVSSPSNFLSWTLLQPGVLMHLGYGGRASVFFFVGFGIFTFLS